MQHTESTQSHSTLARHHERLTDQYTTHTWGETQVQVGPGPAAITGWGGC